MKYKAIYKCRLCGERYEDGITGDSMAIMAVSTLTVKEHGPIGIHLRNVHNCKDGSYGLSDFQGFKKEE